MTTRSHHHGAASRFGERAERRTHYPITATIGVIVGAIVVGAFIGLLLAALVEGPAIGQIHRGGGHGRVLTMQMMEQSAVSAAVATQSSAGSQSAAQATTTRSPARGGFAVSRSIGAAGDAVTGTTGVTQQHRLWLRHHHQYWP